jgi:hypothetical protein
MTDPGARGAGQRGWGWAARLIIRRSPDSYLATKDWCRRSRWASSCCVSPAVFRAWTNRFNSSLCCGLRNDFKNRPSQSESWFV